MLFDDALWINSPHETYKSESKPYQLKVAKKIGFNVPDTFITNDPFSGVDKKIGDYIALKSVDTVLLQNKNNQYFGFTSILKWEECIKSDFSLSPATCQKIISPKLDLRVTVVNNDVWCDAIKFDNKEINGDWRVLKKERLSYSNFNLPEEVRELCISLVKHLGLVYGAIDLALSEGIFWFIEINPTGEWGWLDRPGRGISDAIVDNLIMHRQYVL